MLEPKDHRMYDIEYLKKIATLFFTLGEAAALSSQQHSSWYQRKEWRQTHLRVHLQALDNEHYRDTSQDNKVVVQSGNYYEDIWNQFKAQDNPVGDEALAPVPEKGASSDIRKETSKSTIPKSQKKGASKRSKKAKKGDGEGGEKSTMFMR